MFHILGVVDKLFKFNKPEDLKFWLASSDKDNEEGESVCELTINQRGRGLFTGNLSLELPKDGRVTKTGYCNIRTVRYKVNHNISSVADVP